MYQKLNYQENNNNKKHPNQQNQTNPQNKTQVHKTQVQTAQGLGLSKKNPPGSLKRSVLNTVAMS